MEVAACGARTVTADGPGAEGDRRPRASRTADRAPADAIGVATMMADGTIILRLRGMAAGIVGESVLIYPPGHPDYTRVREHLGMIEPGGTVAVRPWPDER
jgi:hypothetical protein